MGDETMMKVVIADDEVRICQLILALVDWEALGLKVVGTAHNGLEAIEMVRALRPDILITDIRMPGCSGLELIDQVKRDDQSLEIVIISGYAHFEYAQQAIKYGVGDYLLKPISKTELTVTLQKLAGRICAQRKNAEDEAQQKKKTQKDVALLRENLISGLLDQKNRKISIGELQEQYGLQVQDGVFQAFLLKMDCGREELSPTASVLLMEKAQEGLQQAVGGRCLEFVSAVQGFACAGILNYAPQKKEEVRRALKSCINQLELQKSLFRPVSFSVALGSGKSAPEELDVSMKEALTLIEERIVYGTGRLYERMGGPSALMGSGALERYLRDMTHAAEIFDSELLGTVTDTLSKECRETKDVHGYEILETVGSAAEVFAVRTQMAERAEFLEELRRQVKRCSEAAQVFDCLKEFCCGYLARQSAQQESESVRPIRKAKQYIQEHYSEPITQEEVSGMVGLSPAYFSVLFKKTEGEGFARYLINVRMEQAKILLRETNSPVSEICRLVGYNDVKHFTHTFEKAAGVKPAVYRKLYG